MATKFTPWQREKIISAGGIILGKMAYIITLAHSDYDKKLLTTSGDRSEGYIALPELVNEENWINMHSLSNESARFMLLKLGFKREEWDWNLPGMTNMSIPFQSTEGDRALFPGGLLLLSDYKISSKMDTDEKVHLDGKRNCIIMDLFHRIDLEMNGLTVNQHVYPYNQKPTPIEEYGWAFTYEENGSYFLEEAVNKALEVSAERFPAQKQTLQSNGGSLLTPAELEAFQTVGNVISSLGERLNAISAPKEGEAL